MIEMASELEELRPRISVIEVGGAGGNAVASMIRGGVRGVDFVAANTDAQALRASPAERILQLGRRTTQGLGAGSLRGARPDGRRGIARRHRQGCSTARTCASSPPGLGGGTGTGAAPVIAKASAEQGHSDRRSGHQALSRSRAAGARVPPRPALEALRDEVDTLIVIPNQNLFQSPIRTPASATPSTSPTRCFGRACEASPI